MVSFKQLAQLALLGVCQMTSEAQAYEKRELQEDMRDMEGKVEYMEGMEGLNGTMDYNRTDYGMRDYEIGECVENLMIYRDTECTDPWYLDEKEMREALDIHERAQWQCEPTGVEGVYLRVWCST